MDKPVRCEHLKRCRSLLNEADQTRIREYFDTLDALERHVFTETTCLRVTHPYSGDSVDPLADTLCESLPFVLRCFLPRNYSWIPVCLLFYCEVLGMDHLCFLFYQSTFAAIIQEPSVTASMITVRALEETSQKLASLEISREKTVQKTERKSSEVFLSKVLVSSGVRRVSGSHESLNDGAEVFNVLRDISRQTPKYKVQTPQIPSLNLSRFRNHKPISAAESLRLVPDKNSLETSSDRDLDSVLQKQVSHATKARKSGLHTNALLSKSRRFKNGYNAVTAVGNGSIQGKITHSISERRRKENILCKIALNPQSPRFEGKQKHERDERWKNVSADLKVFASGMKGRTGKIPTIMHHKKEQRRVEEEQALERRAAEALAQRERDELERNNELEAQKRRDANKARVMTLMSSMRQSSSEERNETRIVEESHKLRTLKEKDELQPLKRFMKKMEEAAKKAHDIGFAYHTHVLNETDETRVFESAEKILIAGDVEPRNLTVDVDEQWDKVTDAMNSLSNLRENDCIVRSKHIVNTALASMKHDKMLSSLENVQRSLVSCDHSLLKNIRRIKLAQKSQKKRQMKSRFEKSEEGSLSDFDADPEALLKGLKDSNSDSGAVLNPMGLSLPPKPAAMPDSSEDNTSEERDLFTLEGNIPQRSAQNAAQPFEALRGSVMANAKYEALKTGQKSGDVFNTENEMDQFLKDALMQQLNELKDENRALKEKLAESEKEARRLVSQQRHMQTLLQQNAADRGMRLTMVKLPEFVDAQTMTSQTDFEEALEKERTEEADLGA